MGEGFRLFRAEEVECRSDGSGEILVRMCARWLIWLGRLQCRVSSPSRAHWVSRDYCGLNGGDNGARLPGRVTYTSHKLEAGDGEHAMRMGQRTALDSARPDHYPTMHL